MSQGPVLKSQAFRFMVGEHDPRQLRKACLSGLRAVSGGADAQGFLRRRIGLGPRVLMVTRA